MARTKKPKRAPVRNMRPLFVAAYLAQPIGKRSPSKAAIEAGYSPRTASAAGSRLLADVKIQAMIAEADAPVFDQYEVSHQRVVRELALLSFSNVLDYVDEDGDIDVTRLTRDQAAAIQELSVKKRTVCRETPDGSVHELISRDANIKLSSKRQALEALGRHLGLFQNDAGPATTVTFNIIGLVASNERNRA